MCDPACCVSWQATSKRSELLDFIQQEAGVASLLDVRRSEAYDAAKSVDALLNSPAVRDWMRASPQVGTCVQRVRTSIHAQTRTSCCCCCQQGALSASVCCRAA